MRAMRRCRRGCSRAWPAYLELRLRVHAQQVIERFGVWAVRVSAPSFGKSPGAISRMQAVAAQGCAAALASWDGPQPEARVLQSKSLAQPEARVLQSKSLAQLEARVLQSETPDAWLLQAKTHSAQRRRRNAGTGDSTGLSLGICRQPGVGPVAVASASCSVLQPSQPSE